MRSLFLICLLSIPLSVSAHDRRISSKELEDKIYAFWLGQIIGNIYGLPHENKHIDQPGPENFPYGYGSNLGSLKEHNGAFSDDDTDFEYIYLLEMEKTGVELSYRQIADAWKYHVRDRVWLANRAALGLMHSGLTPPVTGMKRYNPHWFQIDPQLINEIWAVTAPGMIDYAVAKSKWAAHITNDDWGVEPTMFYGALFSAAFFESDIDRLIEIGYDHLPSDGRFRQVIDDMKELHRQYPDDWEKARGEMRVMYYDNEPEETRTIWNSLLNGACAILALLYGEGDFQSTLDLSCAMGFDADNQAATLSGLLGLIGGTKGLPMDLLYPVEGWKRPFNNIYKNVTRFDMPDAAITDMSNRTARLAERIIVGNGGRKASGDYIIAADVRFTPTLEFADAPAPIIHKGEPLDHKFIVSGDTSDCRWSISKGQLPPGLDFRDGVLTGTPLEAGCFPITITVSSLSKDVVLRVRNKNLATSAAQIITNVPATNSEVRDSMWYSYGRSLYADDIEVVRDGKYRGPGSVYYSISGTSTLPKIDYYGYRWDRKTTVEAVGFHIGTVEENGGWFSSLAVQYQDPEGRWVNAENVRTDPPLPDPYNIYKQPHFIEYYITFDPVTTKAIRIIGDASRAAHWDRNSNISPFTSITELLVY